MKGGYYVTITISKYVGRCCSYYSVSRSLGVADKQLEDESKVKNIRERAFPMNTIISHEILVIRNAFLNRLQYFRELFIFNKKYNCNLAISPSEISVK